VKAETGIKLDTTGRDEHAAEIEDHEGKGAGNC